MVPKIIHYCWFGYNPLPEAYKRYISTWEKFMPDYEIREWNESNFDFQQNAYCKEAYDEKRWAFVSDYARLKIIYSFGGIYLDTDVELLKSLAPLVSTGVGFIGFQNSNEATTGLGFAAQAENPCIKKMLDIYEGRHFYNSKGGLDLTPCPIYNTVALINCGLKIGKPWCEEVQRLHGINAYPQDYFNPMDRNTKKISTTERTYSIHHYSASWSTSKRLALRSIKKLIPGGVLQKREERISRRDILKYQRLYK